MANRKGVAISENDDHSAAAQFEPEQFDEEIGIPLVDLDFIKTGYKPCPKCKSPLHYEISIGKFQCAECGKTYKAVSIGPKELAEVEE